jgi:hypothetical protein
MNSPHNHARSSYEKTSEFRLQSRVVTIDGVELCIEIWEIGDVHLHGVGMHHRLRHCNAIIFTCNPLDANSVQSCKDWTEVVSQFPGRGNVVRMMVGTHADRGVERKISRAECAQIAAQCNALAYHECSAATGVGIDATIYSIARNVGQFGPDHIRALFKSAPSSRKGRRAPSRDPCTIQ